mmetsp:Transcript_19992/g.46990  ORF Transcript_19992/g.46990 Transcript_19992/m.46990 type:complete len:87 (+) Transcript_19992:272-532(+)
MVRVVIRSREQSPLLKGQVGIICKTSSKYSRGASGDPPKPNPCARPSYPLLLASLLKYMKFSPPPFGRHTEKGSGPRWNKKADELP